MLWSNEVLEENSREMKRLWLAGTIAAGMCANSDKSLYMVEQKAVELADKLLAELNKGSRWEKKT
jgi:hypothetical protein